MKNLKSISTIAIIALVAVLSFSSFKKVMTTADRDKMQNNTTIVWNLSQELHPTKHKQLKCWKTEHQKQMEVYRTERRATTDATLKAEIRTKMDAQKRNPSYASKKAY